MCGENGGRREKEEVGGGTAYRGNQPAAVFAIGVSRYGGDFSLFLGSLLSSTLRLLSAEFAQKVRCHPSSFFAETSSFQLVCCKCVPHLEWEMIKTQLHDHSFLLYHKVFETKTPCFCLYSFYFLLLSLSVSMLRTGKGLGVQTSF